MGTTIFRSVSLFGVIIAIALTYAFVGMVFFSQVRPGEEIDYRWEGRGGEERGGEGRGGEGREMGRKGREGEEGGEGRGEEGRGREGRGEERDGKEGEEGGEGKERGGKGRKQRRGKGSEGCMKEGYERLAGHGCMVSFHDAMVITWYMCILHCMFTACSAYTIY